MATQMAHAIDYSASGLRIDGAVACQREIVRFVRGVRGPRTAPVTKSQIINWFRATPSDFVERQIDAALTSGALCIYPRSLGSARRATGGYIYEATEGECPKCGDESLPERLTGERNALCDDCLGAHLDATE